MGNTFFYWVDHMNMNSKVLVFLAVACFSGLSHSMPVRPEPANSFRSDLLSVLPSAARQNAQYRGSSSRATPAGNSQAANSSWVFGALHPAGTPGDNGRALLNRPSSVNVNPVPIPAPFWLLVSGLFVLGFLRRRAAIAAV